MSSAAPNKEDVRIRSGAVHLAAAQHCHLDFWDCKCPLKVCQGFNCKSCKAITVLMCH